MLSEHDIVALTVERPAEDLHLGDVGAIVHCYPDGHTFEVEFLDERGHSKRVTTVAATQLMRLNLLSLAG